MEGTTETIIKNNRKNMRTIILSEASEGRENVQKEHVRMAEALGFYDG